MSESKTGVMTELARVGAGSVSVVVSYWTNENGEVFQPRLRFLVGERERPSKGLTRNECLDVRDAFNQLCIEWASDDGAAAKEEQTRVYANAAVEIGRELQGNADAISGVIEAFTKEGVGNNVVALKAAPAKKTSGKLATKSPADAIAELMAKRSTPTK